MAHTPILGLVPAAALALLGAAVATASADSDVNAHTAAIEPRPAWVSVESDLVAPIELQKPCMLSTAGTAEAVSRAAPAAVRIERITLADQVLFDVNRARVKSRGKKTLRQLADAWRTHPHWGSLRIEAHSDRRGPERYNQELSELRAARVRAVLVELGVPAEAISSEGFGSSEPLDPTSSPEALDRNRRVEFVIAWTPTPRAPQAAR